MISWSRVAKEGTKPSAYRAERPRSAKVLSAAYCFTTVPCCCELAYHGDQSDAQYESSDIVGGTLTSQYHEFFDGSEGKIFRLTVLGDKCHRW